MLTWIAAALALTGRIERSEFDGLFGLVWWLYALSAILNRDVTWVTYVDAAVGMYFLHQWWKGGGGDDTKRRLRKIKEAFTPQRRTAPVSA